MTTHSARKRGLTLAAGMVLAVVFSMVSAGGASASGSDCNPNPFEVANECTTVIGTGLYVDSIAGKTVSNSFNDIPNVHIQIYGPHGTIHNCSAFTLPALGWGPTCLWVNPTPHVHVTAGDYCTKAWQKVGTNNYVGLSVECINVHS